MDNEKKITCPTCEAEYKKGSQQAKMVKDCGECHSCDHTRIEIEQQEDCELEDDCDCDDCQAERGPYPGMTSAL